MRYYRNIISLSILALVAGCKPEIEEPKPTSGDADLTRFVSIGGSFTAGYSDEALYLEAQQNSYPAILSKSFAEAGGGEFKQPLVNAGVGMGENGNAKYVLGYGSYSCTSENILMAKPAAAIGDASVFNSPIGNNGPYNNLGVPGMRSFNVNDQYFSNTDPQLGNPYYARFAKNPGSSTILSDAVAQNPTFFSFWVGLEDLLGFTLNGGDNSDSVTSLAYYNYNIDNIVNSLSSTAQQGVIANIPDPSEFPYCTTVPYNGLVLTSAQATELNSIFASIDNTIHFAAGNNAFIIADASRPSNMRQIKSNEYVLMSVPLDSIKCASYGSFDIAKSIAKPLAGKYVLDEAELSLIRSRVISYNDKLESIAATYNLAFADIYDLFRRLSANISFNGNTFTEQYISGGMFSLDGVHLTAKGNALVANEFIKAINSTYGASLHEADVNAYPGIKFP